jgi:glycosyltransferase involved in cell wall biosynthesis
MMEEIHRQGVQRLIVVGGGVTEQRDGKYFVKAAVAQYLHQLSSYFPRVFFVVGLSSNTHIYQSALDTTRITPLPWKMVRRPPITILLRTMLVTNKQSAVLLFVPQPTLLFLTPLLRWRVRRFVVYVAGDWLGLAQELRQRGKGWRVPIDNMAVTLPLRWADHVLVRGPKIMSQVQRYNDKITQSLPIVLPEGRTSRNDTCQGKQITLLYVGKLLQGKGLGTVLNALAELRARRLDLAPKLRLCVLGIGEHESLLKNYAQRLELEGIVDFRGYVDVPELHARAYTEADILIMPSIDSEGLPRVIEEALLYHLPVIATRTGGIPYSYVDGEDMLLIPRGQADALAAAIERIVDDGDLRRHLIQNSNRNTQAMLSGHTAAQQHAEIILNLRRVPN